MEVGVDNSLFGIPDCGGDNILLICQTEEYATTAGF